MKMGIIPGWLLAGVIASVIGGFPDDLCAAGAAIGIALSLAALARSSTALSMAVGPIMVLLIRYVKLPPLSSTVPQVVAWVEHPAHALGSPPALIVISLLSIVGSYLLGLKWAYTGEA
ncbi:hypothetical protein DF134_19430 [Burkholderia stagnalis]|uniref:hypothetical protein n=1 Tax=Burkholderia stagnalis TaxID=1503054 RepID=UPI000F59388D|nr:hypothetical protein [Burkholderia stagnalis]RQQ88742.1 hypothetical protein DF134_19430 [Burkholderia stagnalis]